MVPYVFSDPAKEVDGLGTLAISVLSVEEDIVNYGTCELLVIGWHVFVIFLARKHRSFLVSV
jgi:hypothetical protein